ncbi:adenosylmethionine--8-amino-7-oxononanoate transaminase [Thiohalorhabdus methylotrophus]|uniref:Adenosylmethionine-8-amino-7-oxononanoate aminotransferase n=1 Tax=Thiohalorhabdus methylotrophus TaxID=3242694 RepID=A0ABV4TS31_9GAMM
MTQPVTSSQGTENWPTRALDHVWYPYAQMRDMDPPVAVAGAEGCRIRLADGRELVDGTASWWSACHGYRHPHIMEAVHRQLDVLPHVMLGGMTHEPIIRLAERLADKAPGDLAHAMFTESGSVSVEVALKMARQYWDNRGETQRDLFIAFENGYHGDTAGCMGVSDTYRDLRPRFRGLAHEHVTVPLPPEEGPCALERALAEYGERVAGVITEPLIQGAGGMLVHSPAVLRRAAELAHGAGTLFIADEIATGFGRTGSLFASEQAGVAPDIMCLCKALTAGTMPMAATLATRAVFEGFHGPDESTALMHGPTFTGNPLGAAAANASLDLFEREPRLAQVAALEAQLGEELAPLAELPGVVDVRIKGAMGAVQLATDRHKDWMRHRFVDHGVWIRPLGDIAYVTPPLVLAGDDLSRLTDAMGRVIREAFA